MLLTDVFNEQNKAVSDRINGANAPELTNKIKQHGQSENNMGGTAGKPDQAAPSPKEVSRVMDG